MPTFFLAVASGHTGTARVRTGPELSDLALFAVAAIAVCAGPPRVAQPLPREGLTPLPACATGWA